MARVITGVDDVLRRMKAVARSVDGKMLAAAGEHAMKPVRDDAARMAPVRTGRLSREILLESKVVGARSAIASVGPSREAWYGIFPELGTRYHGAQPYLRPALDANVRRVVRRLGGRLWRDVKRVR